MEVILVMEVMKDPEDRLRFQSALAYITCITFITIITRPYPIIPGIPSNNSRV